MPVPTSLLHPKHLLRTFSLFPKKRWSQNFLSSTHVRDIIVEAVNPLPGDYIVEIGPGLGALTEALLAHREVRILAIEKDAQLVLALSDLHNTPQLELIEGDILDFPLKESLQKELSIGKKAKVLSNLPYHLTSPILQLLLPHHHLISKATLMMQKEVATRCMSPPKSKDYSPLSLFVQFYATPTVLCHVPPTAFYPVPKVASTVIEFDLRPFPKEVSSSFLFSLIKRSFQQRRKMIRTSLSPLYKKEWIEHALKATSCPLEARPEELCPTAFLHFALALREKIEQNEQSQCT